MSNMLHSCPDVLTVEEVADILRVPAEDAQKLIDSGELRYMPVCGHTRIHKQVLREYIDNLCMMPAIGTTTPDSREAHLDNRISNQDFAPYSEGETEMAKSKINQYVTIDGKRYWITASTTQEFTDKVAKLLRMSPPASKHPFADYAQNWFNTYSRPNIASATATTYERQLTAHILPAFDGMAIEDITSDDVQRLFNGMTGAKATKNKVKIVLNQIFEAAIEEGYMAKNPLKSKRLKVTGSNSEATRPYAVEQMQYLVQHFADVKNPMDRTFIALLATHPMRLEEVLGLHPGDIDFDRDEIHIHRAVTHPRRNQPEVKETKTASSNRTIGLSSLALSCIPTDADGEFLFGGNKPLSYTQVRRMCARIKRDTGFSEDITPRRFRTTVLTDIYDKTGDVKLTQEAAGHTTAAMTLNRYVKGRRPTTDAAAAIDETYSTQLESSWKS